MALAQPEPGGPSRAGGYGGGLLPQRIAPLRGTLATTACMETLQVGYLLAVAAAAGCSLSQPFPDNGIDWHVSHGAPGHVVDDEVTIKVQLKCTYRTPARPPGATFAFTLDNAHLVKLARTPVPVHKILVVMLVPRSQDEWLRAGHDRLDLRHCCYWTNLAGHAVTGRHRTTVRIPTSPGPPAPPGGSTSLLVPDTGAFPDSEDLLGEALTALARSAAPSARDILVSLAVPSDEIRWWREAPEPAAGTVGAASWTGAEQLHGAARQILLAGALAVRGRAGYHGARHRRRALAALDSILVGPAPGGRDLTAFVPVEAGRPIAVRLHHALHATREAVDHQRATGGMEAFDSAVAAGVSRELTEAVVALVRGSEGAGIALERAPAGEPRRAARCAPNRWSSPRATCPRCAGRAPATSGTNPRSRYGSPAPSYACGAPGRAEPASYGCGCWRAPRSRTCGWSSTRRPTGSRATPTWWGSRYGWRAGWRAGADSGA